MPTRAQAEAELVNSRLLGRPMAAAGLLTTVAGSNADLNSALADALAAVGQRAADPTNVVDADLVALAGAQWLRFLVVAELGVTERLVLSWSARPPSPERDDILRNLQRRRGELLAEARNPLRPADAPAVGRAAVGGRIPASRPGSPWPWCGY